MKTIGRTNENNYLVEMNPDEHTALAMLAGVESGWLNIEAYHTHLEIVFIDLSTTIGAIRHYVQSKTRLVELQNLLNDITDVLDNPDEAH